MFWFLSNLSLVAALNFVVNLTSGPHNYPAMEAVHNYLALDEVEIIKDTLAFNAIIGTIIFFGSISIVLYFKQIRDFMPKTILNGEETGQEVGSGPGRNLLQTC